VFSWNGSSRIAQRGGLPLAVLEPSRGGPLLAGDLLGFLVQTRHNESLTCLTQIRDRFALPDTDSQ